MIKQPNVVIINAIKEGNGASLMLVSVGFSLPYLGKMRGKELAIGRRY